MFTKDTNFAYRVAVYAALVGLTGTLGWVFFQVGMNTPGL
jgi:hypothetical protein